MEKFLEKANKTHENRYDYSQLIYTNSKSKGTIICKVHGAFEQRLSAHIQGMGCRRCSIDKRTGSMQDFKKTANNVHNYKYDYSKFEYMNSFTKSTIVCPIHGNFEQDAASHARGYGCPKCGEKTLTIDSFTEKSKEVHGDKYSYENFKYKNYITKGIIICPIHGEFKQTPASHLNGRGCQRCGIEKNMISLTMTFDEFIEKSKKIHGDKYDYSDFIYINSKTKGIISCPIHGNFVQRAQGHLRGSGCAKCGNERVSKAKTETVEKFIEKSNLVHDFTYDYTKTVYVNSGENLTIVCKKHGEFQQIPDNHLQGKGCSKCTIAGQPSKPELELLEYIRGLYKGTIEQTDKTVLINKGKSGQSLHLDIYLPELKLAFEFNGLYWHSEFNRKDQEIHANKTKWCSEKGVRLIHVWSDEWNDKMKEFIKDILIPPTHRLEARKLKLKTVSIKEHREFLEENHFQGFVGSSKVLGLYNEDELVQLMSLRLVDKKNKVYEIARLATKGDYKVVGGTKRLFKNLLKDLEYTEIISYNNLDKFTGKTYEEVLGMTLVGYSENMFYTDFQKRVSRQSLQKHKLLKKYPTCNICKETGRELTGNEIANNLGYYRVFTAGNSKYSFKREK
jgi:hypothetical protein